MTVTVTFHRQEAEALIDAALTKYANIDMDFFLWSAIKDLALACGMIKDEKDFSRWLDTQMEKERGAHDDE